MLKTNKPLRAKTNLTDKTKLQAKPKVRKKPVRLAKKTAQQLIEPADKAFSKYIRLRDAELVAGVWVAKCISCPKRLTVLDADGKWGKGIQNGHFMSRGFHQLRYDEENCNAQCSHCNAWRDKETMQEAYRDGLRDKYGDDVVKRLKTDAAKEGSRKHKTKAELLEIIEDSKKQVEWLLTH